MDGEKKKIVELFLEKGIILSADFFEGDLSAEPNGPKESLSSSALESLQETVLKIYKNTPLMSREIFILDREVLTLIQHGIKNVNFVEMERAKALYERGINQEMYATFLQLLKKHQHAALKEQEGHTPVSHLIENTTSVVNKEKPSELSVEQAREICATSQEQSFKSDIQILIQYEKPSKKRSVQDFVKYFNKRFDILEGLLRNRQELSQLTSISKIKAKKDKEQVSLIGLVKEVIKTKNNNLILVVEDKTGEINVIVNKNKPELYEEVKNVLEDEVIGIVGVSSGNGVVFSSNVLWPDVPLYHEMKKSPEEEYAIFISDLHVGHKQFLRDDFEKFIKWLKGEVGNEQQKALVSKIKYLFILGDVVDGVGVYPGQENEQDITDIYAQYEALYGLLKEVPKRMTMIICPGNHDAVRLEEPQPVFDEDFAKSIYRLENAIFVSNPSLVNIGKKGAFPGFDILIYHGFSFDYYIAHVDSIRNNGGYDRADLVMKFLLKRRHLAPTHGSSVYIPDDEEDPLVIKKVPDFFVTGHIHKTSVANYRNVTLISGSCWQAKTAYQEKVGHHPEPSRVPVVNLQTREIKVLKFGDQ